MIKAATALLPVVALMLIAAAPKQAFVTNTPMPDFPPAVSAPAPALAPQAYVTAPTPNQDAFGPTTRASNAASVGPGLFTRRDQYRGEGLSASSSAQAEQDRRVKPGAGIKLSVPID